MTKRATFGGSSSSRKQHIVQLCIAALGPYYAGKETQNGVTILLGYVAKQPVPAARIARRSSKEETGPFGINLTVLRPDILNVIELEDWLAELAEDLERDAEQWGRE